ncbi:MAG: spermidine synthase [Halodesulfurarchaeum sp.]
MADRVGRLPRWPTRAESAVLVSGITSMGLEILAGRMIAPQFGSSIYTWGSIIGVFLAALSLGYWRGGERSVGDVSVENLATIMLWTAIYIAVVLYAGDLFLRVSSAAPIPPRFAPLLPVTLLFGPPVYLLGFISPYAAELSGTEHTGAASGRVYALGTIGSIVGAFGTTFVLVPWLGIDPIALLFGAVLVVAAVGLTLPTRNPWPVVRILVVVLLLVGAFSLPTYGVTVPGEVVYETQTPYQHLQVVDRGYVRTLYLDGQPHSAINLDRPNEHVFTYTRYFHLPLLMTEDVDRVLFIGGGGFTGPRIFADLYDVEVDVVEIDPEVIAAAKRYFRVNETDDLHIYQGDGREFLERTNRTYDVIILDAYRKAQVPFHLTTKEFFRLTRARLDDDGVLLANVISAPSGPGSAFFRAEYKTMNRVFPQVHALRTTDSSFVQNVEVVATKREDRLSREELLARNRRRDIGYDMSDAINRSVGSVETDDVPVLSDNYAPVERLLDPMLGRKYVIEGRYTGNVTTRTVRTVG